MSLTNNNNNNNETKTEWRVAIKKRPFNIYYHYYVNVKSQRKEDERKIYKMMHSV